MSASEANRKSEPPGESGRRKRNYKLIVDPELRKDSKNLKKVYRFDGCVPGVRFVRIKYPVIISTAYVWDALG